MASEDMAIKGANINIKVLGIGGGGNSVLQRMAESDFLDIELVAINTEVKQLARMDTSKIKSVQIGEALTKGRGTGGNQEFGAKAAKMEEAKLKARMQGADMIFVTAGMGGGTGTGAAPVVARLAKEMGILTVGVVTVPFAFEGARKKRLAEEGIVRLQAYMDALIVVQNDNLMKLPENRTMSLVEAFHAADEVLKQAIRCVAELILTTGVVNVDFADVTTIFRQSDSSDALLGIGRSKVSAVAAVQQAIESPLIDKSLKGARGIILNITGDDSLSLYDVNEATSYIYKQTDDDVNIIFGTVINQAMDGVIQATIIATDFADSLALKAPTVEVPQNKVAVAANSDLSLEAPSFMQKTGDEPKSGSGAFAIPAFRLTQEEPPKD
ncbi:MAG: cell division protein FtsZ [Selenomonadaceae bacterium]|nr:cell division protein FtsZ [Selenomonadaceae bacterium]